MKLKFDLTPELAARLQDEAAGRDVPKEGCAL